MEKQINNTEKTTIEEIQRVTAAAWKQRHPDKLMSIEVAEARSKQLHYYEGERAVYKQLADTMRELEYYKKLAFDLSTGTAQPSIPNAPNHQHPYKDLEKTELVNPLTGRSLCDMGFPDVSNKHTLMDDVKRDLEKITDIKEVELFRSKACDPKAQE